VNEEKAKIENFPTALNNHQISPILANFINAWETQRYSDGHVVEESDEK
jgi:hypothetical protein